QRSKHEKSEAVETKFEDKGHGVVEVTVNEKGSSKALKFTVEFVKPEVVAQKQQAADLRKISVKEYRNADSAGTRFPGFEERRKSTEGPNVQDLNKDGQCARPTFDTAIDSASAGNHAECNHALLELQSQLHS